jgi:hypothetical protein
MWHTTSCRRRELERPANRFKRTRTFGKASVLKAGAMLIVLCMLSILPSGSGDDAVKVRATAAPGAFSPPVMVNSNRANDQTLPVIVETPDNGLFVVWQDSRSGNEDIYTSKSMDNGTTYRPDKRADDSIGTSKQIEPAVAVSTNGTILLVWQDNRRSTFDFDIFFTKSTDGGNTYSKNVRVDDPTSNLSWQERPSIAVTSGGTIYVAWTDDRAGAGHTRIRGAISTDWGATFSASKEIVSNGSTSGQDGVSVVSNGNRIFVVFMDNFSGVPYPYLCISTNNGKSFGAPIRLDDSRSDGASKRGVSMAPMPGGGIVAAWEDNRSGNWDIYMSIVSAHGVITTSDIRVDDDSTGAIQSSVSIAADQLGNVYTAWMDDRDSLYAIRFSSLKAGSTAFNSSIAVATPGSNDMQRRPSIIATAPGLVYVVWQDDKTNTYDVYSSSAHFPELFGIALTDGWNFVSIPSDMTGFKASTLGLRNGTIVTRWNSTTQTYDRSYIVGVSPPFMDFSVSDSTGYWIHSSVHDTMKLKGTVPSAPQSKRVVVPHAGGWVIVGFESLNVTRFASDIPKMFDVAGAVSMVCGYDVATGSWSSYVTGAPPGMDFALAPGEAYWCWCTTNATLTYAP